MLNEEQKSYINKLYANLNAQLYLEKLKHLLDKVQCDYNEYGDYFVEDMLPRPVYMHCIERLLDELKKEEFGMKMTEEQKIQANLTKLPKERLISLIMQLLFDKSAMQTELDNLKNSSKK